MDCADGLKLMAELAEAKERTADAVELLLTTVRTMKGRQMELERQCLVQESLKKSIDDSRERALREVDRLKAELAEAKKPVP